MLIDYVGLPGCGKTYQTNLAKDYCKSKSISFIDFSHGKNAPFLIKVILLTIEKGLLYTTRYKRNLLEIKKKCLYIKKECIVMCVVNYIFMYTWYRNDISGKKFNY